MALVVADERVERYEFGGRSDVDCVKGSQRRLSDRTRCHEKRAVHREQRDRLECFVRAVDQQLERKSWFVRRGAADRPRHLGQHQLAGNEIGKALEQNLVFDESKQISKLKTDIAAALAKPEGRGIALTGKIDSFGEPKVSWTKDGFLALMSAKGTLAAKLSMKGME